MHRIRKCTESGLFWDELITILLLNTTCPVLANSLDPDQLASSEAHWSGSALFVFNMFISIKNPDQEIWLAGSGLGILFYSAWQGLNC